MCGDGGWLGKYLRKRTEIDLELMDFEQQAQDAGEQRKRYANGRKCFNIGS